MCEFNVILDGKIVFGDVIYAKVEGSIVTVRNVIGETKAYENVRITEVDVAAARFVLETVRI
jgi:predicted RNA-binding protein